MTKAYDVIIAGAGPVGLLLACELSLARTSVLVLERDPSPESPWKGKVLGFRGLQTSSNEAFYRRGLLQKFFDDSERPNAPPKGPRIQFGGHFAGIPLNANKIDLNRWKYKLPGPTLMPGPTTIEKTETILTERAESLGVEIIRGHAFDSILAEDENGITVGTRENGQSFRGRWLVGCDGGRSTIRKAAGFEFTGTEATLTGYALHCDVDHPERLQKGFVLTDNGMYISTPMGALHLLDFDGGAGQKNEFSQGRMQDVLNRITGKTDVQITKIHLASAWTDRSKQVTTYRKGRVLLAGDAAHIHPPLGAQGMNAGLGDAMNLGWKLAATIRMEQSQFHKADFSLLDTYEKERHPVGAAVLDWNRAQVATLQPTPTGRAVKALMKDLINTDDGVNHFIDRVWGLSQRYTLGTDLHPLIGYSVPDFTFKDGTKLGPKLEAGRGLLVSFEDKNDLKETVSSGRYDGMIEYLGQDVEDRLGLGAVLIRPDGFVAWVSKDNEEPDIGELETALKTWFDF